VSDDNSSGTTIKYGAGFDHPWFTARGTVLQQRKQIAEVFGVEAGEKTLAELTVEAALVAIGLTNAATGIGAKPGRRQSAAPDALDEASAAARSGSKTKTQEIVDRVTSIADKAKQEAQPEDATDDTFALIATAMSRKALEDIREAARTRNGSWTSEHQLQARQRLAELEK
jgi:hypothetical protein